VVSDWSQNHFVFHDSNVPAIRARMQQDPRWVQSWYLHHREVWWPSVPRGRFQVRASVKRDWNVSLGSVTFAPLIDGTGNVDPGGGETSPAKFTFDVTATPDCTNDYVAIGLPTSPVAGGQANIVAYNNLYSSASGGFCTGTGPNVLFAYASGTGMIPAAISMSLDGTQLAYIEDIAPNVSFPTGAANFHILTRDLSGNPSDTNGTGATGSVVPGATGGNAAVDTIMPITPDGGTTNQASTTAPFINYATNAAYVTTYTYTPHASGYIYKISPVFGGGTPLIVWSAVVDCSSSGPPGAPSSPIYDSTSNRVFFTDNGARIDYVVDSGSSPTVVCGNSGTDDDTAANPPVVDSINELVFATFNDNGANEYATEVEATDLTAGSDGVLAGGENTAFTGPYDVDFSNDYYNCDLAVSKPCAGTPLMYIAGTDTATGTVPTLYAASFNSNDLGLTGSSTSTALATGAADSSPVTEFYNSNTSTDYLFVGVTNNCAATTVGGTAGCVMSLNITSGLPAVVVGTTAIPASGGSTGIVVDNDSGDAQASSIYYATKTGGTLVKATQSGLQ
jgi:hypothetical protein